MGAYFEQIPESLIKWILEQKCIWVATAPLAGDGHVNVSPKGCQTDSYFGVPDRRTFWYQDLSGSGNETIAHLHEPGNGRITIMLNAFDGPPKIVRLWGKGRVLECGTSDFDKFVEKYNIETLPGTRSIIIVDIHQVGTSCGFSVPYYDFKEHRPILNDFFEKKKVKFDGGDEKESMDRYWALKSSYSMDGLPSMRRGLQALKENVDVKPIKKMVGPLAPKNGITHSDGFTLEQVIIIFIAAFVAGMMAITMSPAAFKNLLAVLPGDSKRTVWLPQSMK